MERHKGSAHSFDRIFHAFIGRGSLGLSPAPLMLAYADWLAHLAIAPAKQAELQQKFLRKFARLSLYSCKCAINPEANEAVCIEPLPQDKRFREKAWQRYPFNLIYQSFLLTQQWWHNATTDIHGVAPHHEDAVAFVARQFLD